MTAVGAGEESARRIERQSVLPAAGLGGHGPVARVDDEPFAADVQRRFVGMEHLPDHPAVVSAASVDAVIQPPDEIVEQALDVEFFFGAESGEEDFDVVGDAVAVGVFGEEDVRAGADGLYFDGVRSKKELKKIGEEFKGFPLATTILEGGGETPWVAPDELSDVGFSMILYPTTILFRMTKTIQNALADLKAGREMPKSEAVDMKTFETIVDLPFWAAIETKFQGDEGEQGDGPLRRVLDRLAG